MYLRDLSARIDDLAGDDRRRAEGILARPSDGDVPFGVGYQVPPEEVKTDCSEHFCIHWVETTADAPAVGEGSDLDANGIPDWIDSVRTEMTTIRSTIVDVYGFRAPKSDLTSANNGGDERLDIYIQNLHPFGIFGYCTTDDPNVVSEDSTYQFFDASAYCVLDNDYAEFAMPGLPSLQVTAAHEFFHAVQFAYDAFEDVWLMEGTAVWVEDEVYDDINDNYQFLSSSHLSEPGVPLDYGDVEDPGLGLFPYGTFLFWRFLSEYPDIGGGPEIIREVWERADASPTGGDDYSLLAVENEIASRNSRFRFAFNDFGIRNFVAGSFYEEGQGYRAAVGGPPPLSKNAVVKKARPRKSGNVTLDHLTTAYAAFRPGRGVKRTGARLIVRVDGPRKITGTEAALLVFRKNGNIGLRYFRLNNKGNGSMAAPFGRRGVSRLVVVLSNASTRFDLETCFQGFLPFYSCGGALPLDDGKSFSFVGRLRQ